ncbi:MAG TPA: hypothetical protein VFH97_03685, partial [Gemmatimonadales bacterium]|nr:hypothetical protein [Gemmatimonadales bacterium]
MTSGPRAGSLPLILLAHPDARTRAALERSLRDGHRVQGVAHARDALEAARADPPDLVLAHARLPGLDATLLPALRSS